MRQTIACVALGLVGMAGAASANSPCLSDGMIVANQNGGDPYHGNAPVSCPVEFYVAPAFVGSVAVFINGVETTWPFHATDTHDVNRDRSVCSTLDPTCWTWVRDRATMRVISVDTGTPFQAGTTVGLGLHGGQPWPSITIGGPAACPTAAAFDYEMCADPIGGQCTGDPFTCDNGDGGQGGPHDDGGLLLCDGGVGGSLDAPAATDGDGGGCSTGGGGGGLALIGLAALGLRRRRR